MSDQVFYPCNYFPRYQVYTVIMEQYDLDSSCLALQGQTPTTIRRMSISL